MKVMSMINNREEQFSALIAGFGGQGILFMGKLLAHAAMLEGKNVTWFPSYGAEMRGGTANCMVIISNEMIGSPVVGVPGVLIALNKASKERFESKVKKGGIMLMDSSLINETVSRKDLHVVGMPASEFATNLESPRSANMVMMGALLSEDGLPDEDTVFRALEHLTPPKRWKGLEKNKEAIRKGKAYCDDKKSQGI
jgi:2-oxoglutarate ferredoxin oxidoreductase subunit gamma